MQCPVRPKGGRLTQLLKSRSWREGNPTYPQGTFEALLVVAVDRRENLQELLNALLVVEVGDLFEGLLDQLAESFGLKRRKK